MKFINTMPSYLGAQLYPNKMPVHHSKIKVNQKPIKEFLEIAPKDSDEKTAELKNRMYKDYLRYVIAAPINKTPKSITNKLHKMDIVQLEQYCADNDINIYPDSE